MGYPEQFRSWNRLPGMVRYLEQINGNGSEPGTGYVNRSGLNVVVDGDRLHECSYLYIFTCIVLFLIISSVRSNIEGPMKFYNGYIMKIVLILLSMICYQYYGVLSTISSHIPYFIQSFLDIEMCTDYWITNDLKSFQEIIDEKVFGQPFLKNALIPILEGHFLEANSRTKPLAISFHGSPGTGKTLVSQLLADSLFKRGRDSSYYKHYTMADVHYLSQSEKLLIDDIKDRVKKCPRTLFVFDEIEKMPDGTFETIKPFLDYYHTVDNVQFRHSIFIFISNIGMEKINTLSKEMWDNGLKREEYKLSVFEHHLLDIIYEADGGLKGTGVVKNYLIDLYLPFLPLEKKHIEQCVRALDYDIPENNINYIMEDLLFTPPEAPLYSVTGCKSVRSLVRRSYIQHDEL